MEQTRIRWLGLACIVGGLLFFAINVVEVPSIASNLLGVVLLLGLAGRSVFSACAPPEADERA